MEIRLEAHLETEPELCADLSAEPLIGTEVSGLEVLRGEKGDQGPEGPQGPKGEKGDQGERGPAGPQGEQGPQGIQGVQGPRGYDGIQGPQGMQGERGFTGEPGPQGPKGDTGPQGAQGDTGPQGPQGPAGRDGVDGKTPVKGIDYFDGERGPQGIQGPAGRDFSIYKTYASVIAMNADKANVPDGSFVLIASNVEDEDNAKMYVKAGSSFTFLTDMSGAQGMKGDQGPQGVKGDTGPAGHTPTDAELTALINAQGFSKFSGSYDDLTGKPTIPTTPAQVGAAPASHTHEASEVGSFAATSFATVANCYIDNSNGTQISYNSWSATDFVDIQGKSVRVSWGQTSSWCAWYDSSKKFISGFSASTSQTLTPPANAKYLRMSNTSTGMASLSIKLGASLDDVLDTKQDVISDLATIRSGAAKGATALQSFTETDPTVPSWAKAASKPTYTASEVGALPADTAIPPQQFFIINEDDCTITTDATKGVAPYSTSYGYTNVIVKASAGVEWVEGAWYTFIIDTKLVVSGTYRNVRISLEGEKDANGNQVWHPLMGYTTSIIAGSTYFVKNMTTMFQYKSTIRTEGALHLYYDSNTTYAYLVNTVIGDATSSPITIDSTGYGARYSLIFPTTVDRTKWSSLVKSSGNGTAKAATPCTFYAQDPMYIYSANVAAGAKPINSVYQYYQSMDLRYTANISSTYLPAYDRAFLWLKDFNPADKSFKADNTIGNIVGGTKLGTRWATSVTGDVYLYWLGYTNSAWYGLSPLQVDAPRIWKYTPATGALVPWVQSGFSGSYNDLTNKPTIPAAVTDDHINSLIDAKLGVIENGTY